MTFVSTTTPNPEALFSPMVFTSGIDEAYNPTNPGILFTNPIDHLYALFTYDQMTPGAQWTALWYLGNELIHYESKPWDGQTGGFGYTDWIPGPGEPIAGLYEVQIFVGLDFKISGQFEIEGEPPTPKPSATPTRTPRPTNTPIPTRTPRPTSTPIPTRTPRPTATPIPTQTPVPTNTVRIPVITTTP
jgi:hypothetical protein